MLHSPSQIYENHQLILDHIDSHMSQDIEDHIPQFYKKSSISSTSSPEPQHGPSSSHYHHQHHIYRPAVPQHHQQFRVIKDGRQMYEESGYQVSSSENFKSEHQHQMAPPTSTVVAVSNAHSSGSVGSSSGHKMKIISSEEPSSSMPDLEFDGTNVLCRVCGDKASGFHYGVHSCEGCKGFFRRSIQQKIQYRPCTKNQQCMIQRVNRNRCQYCRLKKCIAVGMSRDAVRFGRVPKREKARIEAAMQQQTRNRALTTHVWTDGIEDVQSIIDTVVGAHMETCEFTRERVREMKLRAKDCPNYTEPTRACPLNPAPEIQSEQEFSQRFADVIRGVIEFAGKIPGFELLAQGDKFTLLKAGLFDALFVRLIGMFDTSLDSIVCLNGQLMRRDSIQNGANARFLVDSTFKFAERINAMQLNDAEVALFCAVVLIAPDRHGIRNYELIQRMHAKLKQCLQHVIVKGRPNEPEFMANLMNTIGDLKTLSTLHTEKLVVFRNEMNQQMSTGLEQMTQQIQVTDVSTLQKPLTQQQQLNSTTSPPLNGHHYQQSPSPHHQPQIRMCPRIMDAQSSDGSMSTITSSEPSPPPPQMQMCPAKQSPILLAKLQGCPMGYQAQQQQQQRKIIQHRSSTESPTSQQQQQLSHPNIPAGTTITAVTRPMTQNGQTTVVQTVTRKLDSPTDSGIESGSDGGCVNGPKIGSGSSSCSSPRSSLEDVPVMTQSLAESLPTLKRALEKPAIFDPNMYHKKFRRCPQSGSDAGSPPIMIHHNEPSQLQTILTAPRNHGHLAMTHSNLVDRLKMAPKMSEEHRKNQELLNRFIDQGGVIKSTAKVHISAAPMMDTMEGAPLNLSKKTAQTTTIVIGNGGSVSVNGDADTKIMVEA